MAIAVVRQRPCPPIATAAAVEVLSLLRVVGASAKVPCPHMACGRALVLISLRALLTDLDMLAMRFNLALALFSLECCKDVHLLPVVFDITPRSLPFCVGLTAKLASRFKMLETKRAMTKSEPMTKLFALTTKLSSRTDALNEMPAAKSALMTIRRLPRAVSVTSST